MAHSNWAEWIYLGVVTALLIYVGAEAWNVERIIDAIDRGAKYARNNFYRKGIHLFYSTTSIHESAIEKGYSITY